MARRGGARGRARRRRPARHRPGRVRVHLLRGRLAQRAPRWWCPRCWSAGAGGRWWLTTDRASAPTCLLPSSRRRRRPRRPRPTSPSPTAPSPAPTGPVPSRPPSARIAAGDLDKVVLARDLVVDAQAPIDARSVLQRLAERYDNTLGLRRRRPRRRHARSCSSGWRRAWSPPACWPARSAVPVTTPTTWPWPRRWPARPRTWRSTSTPCARSPTPSPRTARR